ncbi:MAG TPA: alpha-ketoglutarate-dependent dioxygenase AlkB [Bacteroidales bacterium]|nr:alpha-ketoglutarate-dependent dioxygenase AlkB [Bacteroidales bacterium]
MKGGLPEYIPEGFEYYPDFISVREEENLLNTISAIELQTFVFQGFTAKRRVASFGFIYSFDNRKLSEGEPIPGEFSDLIGKTASLINISPAEFAEALITEYPEGSVINWHRDAPPFGLIAGISLLSDCRFRLRPHDKKMQERSAIISFIAERRSLYVMRGPARSEWEHSIAAVKEKRYSITLRTLK